MLHLFWQKFKGPDYHRDEGVKGNFSAEFVAISGMPSLYSEFGNDTNHVPVEMDPNFHLEPREQDKIFCEDVQEEFFLNICGSSNLQILAVLAGYCHYWRTNQILETPVMKFRRRRDRDERVLSF